MTPVLCLWVAMATSLGTSILPRGEEGKKVIAVKEMGNRTRTGSHVALIRLGEDERNPVLTRRKGQDSHTARAQPLCFSIVNSDTRLHACAKTCVQGVPCRVAGDKCLIRGTWEMNHRTCMDGNVRH